MTDRMQTVQGRCPACGASSLFLGDGGHVTCSRLECSNPSAADELLHAEHGDADAEVATWTPSQPGDRREQLPDHVYLSTGCFHGDHDYCKSMTGLNGAKRPAECKKCGAKCICPCHREQPNA